MVAPIFKKGSRHLAENYRPVSLTSVPCKIMEHIICSHIRGHLDKHNILSKFQHGFRKGHSCESQLLITLNELMYWRDCGVQCDIAVLDFAKAFDTVPHESLLGKLEHYGINANIHMWIRAFLSNRTQEVVVDGVKSNRASVASGVPQGTVLGPLLFLLHINDLPDNVQSRVRLFADDCLLYRAIQSVEDAVILQNDLDALKAWGDLWGMKFNVKKCNILTVSRSRTPITKLYTLGGEALSQVDQAKYLGVLITEELSWSPHITSITSKANGILGFLQRNLKRCPKPLKELAYMTLVRSKLEYCAAIWDPYLKKDIHLLDKVQRRSARYVCNNYDYMDSSVTAMLKELGWLDLAQRRKHLRLALFYKIVNDLIAVPHEDILERADPRTRAGNKKNYRPLNPDTNCYKYSFFGSTILDWNRLPQVLVESPSVDSFKAGLYRAACPTANTLAASQSAGRPEPACASLV